MLEFSPHVPVYSIYGHSVLWFISVTVNKDAAGGPVQLQSCCFAERAATATMLVITDMPLHAKWPPLVAMNVDMHRHPRPSYLLIIN